MARNKRENELAYFAVGFGVGVGAAFMLAPKMGKEVREALAGAALLLASRLGKEIREEVDKVVKQGYDTAHEITDELSKAGREIVDIFVQESKSTIVKSSDRILEAIEEARDTISKSAERFSEAIEVGKQAYMEEKYGRNMQS